MSYIFNFLYLHRFLLYQKNNSVLCAIELYCICFYSLSRTSFSNQKLPNLATKVYCLCAGIVTWFLRTWRRCGLKYRRQGKEKRSRSQWTKIVTSRKCFFVVIQWFWFSEILCRLEAVDEHTHLDCVCDWYCVDCVSWQFLRLICSERVSQSCVLHSFRTVQLGVQYDIYMVLLWLSYRTF